MASYQQDSYQDDQVNPPAYNPDYVGPMTSEGEPSEGSALIKNDLLPPGASQQQQPPPPPPGAAGQYAYDNRLIEKISPSTKCQDSIWVLLFLSQLFLIIGLSIYYYIKNSSFLMNQLSTDDHSSFINCNFWILGGSVIFVSFFSASIWLIFIRRFSYCLIWFSLILTLSMWIIYGIISIIILGDFFCALVAFICAMIQVLWMYCVRNRIRFASVILSMAVTACDEYSKIYLISFLSMFIQACWIIIWIIGFTFAIYDASLSSDSSSSDDSNNGDNNNSFSNDSKGVLFLFILSFYWTCQVIANTVHVTSAGVVATWYFLFSTNNNNNNNNNNNVPRYPVGSSLKRAITTSFGSICFGSFLIAFIQTIRAMLRLTQRSRNGFIQCCILCILACLQDLLEYFNLYAFTRVAIYGTSYCQSAKETLELFRMKGFDAIINDDLTAAVLNISCLFAALLSAAVISLLSYFIFDDHTYWYYWAIIAAIVAISFALCIMVVVRSGVATIFVCFAEDPMALATTKPAMYNTIVNAWREMYSSLPWARY